MGISSSEKYKKSKLLLLPDYLLTNKIFPFLSDKELFLTLRKVHPYLNLVIKSSLGENYLEEIKLRLKLEKDILIKEYENKISYLMNIRNLLMFYNINTNMMEKLKLCVDYLDNENILKLIIIFTEIFFENDFMDLLLNDNINIQEKKNLILENINDGGTFDEFLLRLNMILDINNDNENDLFNGLKLMFYEIDTDNVENINESCRLINSFLQNLFDYQELKIETNNMKIKIDNI